jgi:phage FluMu protein Com
MRDYSVKNFCKNDECSYMLNSRDGKKRLILNSSYLEGQSIIVQKCPKCKKTSIFYPQKEDVGYAIKMSKDDMASALRQLKMYSLNGKELNLLISKVEEALVEFEPQVFESEVPIGASSLISIITKKGVD